MFSDEISIRNGDSHPISEKDSGKRINYSKDIFIGNHVWIGARAIILKGVAIGDNSVVGIGTIVTKDVPASSIVGGVPSSILKSNITWERSF